MAAEQNNIIQVVIESVNKMSQDLRQIEGEMRKLEGTTGTTAKAMGAAGVSTHRMMNTMSPLRTLLIQLTGVAGGFGTALFNLIRFGLSPMGLAISGLVAFMSSLIAKMIDAKKESELFNKSLEEQAGKIVDLNLRYRVLIGTLTAVQAGVQKIALQQAPEREKLSEELLAIEKRLTVKEGDQEGSLLKFGMRSPSSIGADIKRREEIQKRLQGLDLELRRTKTLGDTEKSEEERKKRLANILKAEGESMLKEEQEEFYTHRDIQRALVQTDQEALEERLKLQEEYNKRLSLELQKAEDQDSAELESRKEDVFKLTQKAHEAAEEAAEDYAKTFADRLVSAMEGEKMDIQGIFRSIGRVAMVGLIEEITKMAILGPLKELFASDALTGGKASKGGLFGGIFKSIGTLFGLGSLFGAGRGAMLPGNFVPIGPLRKFATGGTASGPTLGVIGEEGPEIVARMKPARPGEGGGENITQNIYLVDGRPPRLGPRDVVLYITKDMFEGGRSAEAVQNIIKRTR